MMTDENIPRFVSQNIDPFQYLFSHIEGREWIAVGLNDIYQYYGTQNIEIEVVFFFSSNWGFFLKK